MNRKEPVIKNCPQCGVEFRRPPSQAYTKFCGAACWWAHHAAKEKVCQQCGKTYGKGGPRRTRGTGEKFCSQACRGLALRRRVEHRCRDCGRVQLRIASDAKRYLRCAECGAAYRAARLRGRPLPHVTDPVARERWLRTMRSPEHRECLSEALTGHLKGTEKTRRGSARHIRALHFWVKTPAGVPYQVDNLSEFVRSHLELFDPEDVVNRSRVRASYQSRATAGLGKLQAVVGTRLSWKGWTLAFGCRDELGRQALSVEEARVHASGCEFARN